MAILWTPFNIPVWPTFTFRDDRAACWELQPQAGLNLPKAAHQLFSQLSPCLLWAENKARRESEWDRAQSKHRGLGLVKNAGGKP